MAGYASCYDSITVPCKKKQGFLLPFVYNRYHLTNKNDKQWQPYLNNQIFQSTCAPVIEKQYWLKYVLKRCVKNVLEFLCFDLKSFIGYIEKLLKVCMPVRFKMITLFLVVSIKLLRDVSKKIR